MTTGLTARRVSVSALLACGVLPAWAGSGAQAAADAEALQLIVVTATRIPTPEAELASSVTVVTADEIAAQQQRTFADVLRNIPGLNVVQQGGPGSVTSVFMRGTSSNHTKVLVDGIDVGDPSNDDSSDNLTLSTKLGLDVTPSFDLGLVARYTSTHLNYTGEDFSTFPALPAAEQSESNTDEYYGRATARLALLKGALNQTLGVAFMRNQTATLQPQTPETLNTGERVKVDWQGALRLAGSETLLLGVEDARDEISQPLSASMRIDSGYVELQSRLGGHWYSALNARYDDNDRFGGKLTWRVAPAWVSTATGTKPKAAVA